MPSSCMRHIVLQHLSGLAWMISDSVVGFVLHSTPREMEDESLSLLLSRQILRPLCFSVAGSIVVAGLICRSPLLVERLLMPLLFGFVLKLNVSSCLCVVVGSLDYRSTASLRSVVLGRASCGRVAGCNPPSKEGELVPPFASEMSSLDSCFLLKSCSFGHRKGTLLPESTAAAITTNSPLFPCMHFPVASAD